MNQKLTARNSEICSEILGIKVKTQNDAIFWWDKNVDKISELHNMALDIPQNLWIRKQEWYMGVGILCIYEQCSFSFTETSTPNNECIVYQVFLNFFFFSFFLLKYSWKLQKSLSPVLMRQAFTKIPLANSSKE